MLYQPTARTRVAGSFPNTAACLRLISMLIVGKTKTGPRGDFGSPVLRLPSLVLYREANIANHVSDQVDGSKRTYPINGESPRNRPYPGVEAGLRAQSVVRPLCVQSATPTPADAREPLSRASRARRPKAREAAALFLGTVSQTRRMPPPRTGKGKVS